ncbi:MULTISPECIES: hypothetical protein [Alteromonas]|uniref:hypothetical protein n=1 Tax=Alteromonas TaxID=226 RepID=UPI000C4843A9|nr:MULTISPECIES: hypothetical protein [Alteromonas]MAW03968.1 hypothetical protein [Alteromonas sp.]MBL3809610.1 hypothetical protein [Alteromonas macleodii]MBL3883147.1 hypothetical protein [Alteromonas macleodii]MBS07586.1 hypothetical protein [Alteromonas sp.]MCZ4240077.1 hypothetical protein [Alteromonas macleodii]
MPRSFWKLSKILFSLSLWSFRNISSIPLAAARAVIDSVRSSEPNNDLLTLVGIIAGHNIQAEELLIAIRNELIAASNS